MHFDYLLVGGGLQNALIALSLLAKQPKARVCLVERGASIGGDHLWSFHEGDAQGKERALLAPLVGHRWERYRVAFLGLHREVPLGYATISSSRVDEVVRARFASAPGSELLLGASVSHVTEKGATLTDGTALTASLVIDGRGPAAYPKEAGGWFQKFLGLELRFKEPPGWSEPLIMDTEVPQSEGLRFVYVLPLSPNRYLIEDTYYSERPGLEPELLRQRIFSYVKARGLGEFEVGREETGSLRIPKYRVPLPSSGPLLSGYAGGWFHPTTGYSLPVAARLACYLAEVPLKEARGRGLWALRHEVEQQASFCLSLNSLLFEHFYPEDRWRVMSWFYKQPLRLIERFYAMRLSSFDKLQFICRRPPKGFLLRPRLLEAL